MIPPIEEFQKALANLLFNKQPHEGVKNITLFTLYTKEQVDAVVNVIGGWEAFAQALENREIQLNITHDNSDFHVFLCTYIKNCLLSVKSKVNVASFKPLNNQE